MDIISQDLVIAPDSFGYIRNLDSNISGSMLDGRVPNTIKLNLNSMAGSSSTLLDIKILDPQGKIFISVNKSLVPKNFGAAENKSTLLICKDGG